MISVSTGGGTCASSYASSGGSSATHTSSANTAAAHTTYATSSLVEFGAHRRGGMMLIPRIRWKGRLGDAR